MSSVPFYFNLGTSKVSYASSYFKHAYSIAFDLLTPIADDSNNEISYNDYTVAWICTLPLEMTAAKRMMLYKPHHQLS
jgi:hypothetical protein